MFKKKHNEEKIYNADLSAYQNNKNNERKPLTKKKKGAKQIMMMRIWDVILILLFTITSTFLSYLVYSFHILPTTWIYMIIGVLMLLLFCFILLTVLRVPIWLIWFKRILLAGLSCALAYGCVFARTAYDTLQVITTPDSETMININVITLKDSDIRTVEDLNGKSIGNQNVSDLDNSQYARQQLSADATFSNAQFIDSLDYTDLYKQLKEGTIDAMIITNSYISLLKNTYPEIEDEIRIVSTYQKVRENANTSTGKDIRYDPFTVFIYGMEDMGEVSEDLHNDVNMLLMVNPKTNYIQMVSLPRDAYVPNPILGYQNDKLTHTGMSGVENAELAIENLFGIEIDYYAKVNFASMIEIVDTIGGIDVDVELSFCEQDENRSTKWDDLICLNAGMQHLNGKQALAYSRHRKTEDYGDIGRTRAQQKIIQGIVNKLLTTDGIASISDLMKVAQTKVVTNMPMDQVTNFISYELDRIKPWSMSSMTVDSYGEMLVTASMGSSIELSCEVLDMNSAQEALSKFSQLENQLKMQDFTFDLDNLQHETLTLPQNNRIVWWGYNLSPYKAR